MHENVLPPCIPGRLYYTYLSCPCTEDPFVADNDAKSGTFYLFLFSIRKDAVEVDEAGGEWCVRVLEPPTLSRLQASLGQRERGGHSCSLVVPTLSFLLALITS